MRTAITLGKTHEGKAELLSGPEVPLAEQQAGFKKRRLTTADAKYAEILYVELDYAQRHKYRTPEAQAQHDKNMADNQRMHAEAQKPQAKSITTGTKKPEASPPKSAAAKTEPETPKQ